MTLDGSTTVPSKAEKTLETTLPGQPKLVSQECEFLTGVDNLRIWINPIPGQPSIRHPDAP